MNFISLITKFYDENLHDFNNRDDFIAKGIDILNSIVVKDANFDINEAFIPILKKHFYKNQEAFTGDIPSVMKKDNQYYVRYKENYGSGLEDNTISLNNILPIDYCFILFKFAEAGLLGDIIQYKDSEFYLKDKKQELIEKVNSFYNTTATFMIIKNGAAQPITANQSFTDKLNDMVDMATHLPNNIYPYRVAVPYGEPVTYSVIKISLNALKNIIFLIAKRKGYCCFCRDHHITIINTIDNIKDVEHYNYFNDYDGKTYQPTEVITLDNDGNLLNNV